MMPLTQELKILKTHHLLHQSALCCIEPAFKVSYENEPVIGVAKKTLNSYVLLPELLHPLIEGS